MITSHRHNKTEQSQESTSSERQPQVQTNRKPEPAVSPLELQAALGNPQAAHPETVMHLQDLVGNSVTCQLIQRKLMVGPADNRYEQEADQMAQQVMRKDEGEAQPVQRQEDQEELQASPPLQCSNEDGLEVGLEIEQQLEANQDSGSSLPHETRAFMESRFGADFSDVHVHTNTEAAQLNHAVQAQAFTHGNDIYFSEGKYNPDTEAGKQLLAHELTHTIQQDGAETLSTEGRAFQGGLGAELSKISDGYSSTYLQRKHIQETINTLANSARSGERVVLKYNQHGTSHEVVYDMQRWEQDIGHFGTREEAIEAERTWLSNNGEAIGGVNGNKIAVNITPPRAAGQEQIGGTHYYNTEGNKHWPFVLRIVSTYGDANTNRYIDVKFSRDKYGYIFCIHDNNHEYNMEVPSEMLGNLFFEEQEFSSQHRTSDDRDIMAGAIALNDAVDADDQTKIIAEGARWNAVRDKADAGELRDDTKFYPSTKMNGAAWGDAEQVPYIMFKDLWTKWNKFNKQWNISNQILKDKLINSDIGSLTDTIGNLRASRQNHEV